jgi:hypothetical protein
MVSQFCVKSWLRGVLDPNHETHKSWTYVIALPTVFGVKYPFSTPFVTPKVKISMSLDTI